MISSSLFIVKTIQFNFRHRIIPHAMKTAGTIRKLSHPASFEIDAWQGAFNHAGCRWRSRRAETIIDSWMRLKEHAQAGIQKNNPHALRIS